MAKVVNLSGRALSSLPVEICEHKTLRSLDCKHNNLSDLPNKFRRLINLKVLLLGSNRFTEIPPCVIKLTGLVAIDISYNRLTSLPDSMCDLVHLEYLDASYNNIRQLPTDFGMKLIKLKKLFLCGNPLEDPPLEVCNEGLLAIREYRRNKKVFFRDDTIAIIGDCVINNFNKGTLLDNVAITAFKKSKAKSIYNYLQKYADLKGVRTLIIHAGTHDCAEGKMSIIRDTADELRETVKELRKKHDNLKIVISGVIPRNDYYYNDCRVMNDYFRQACKEDKCLFIDHESCFTGKSGVLDAQLFTRNGVNLNSRGALALATNLNKFVPILKNHTR